MSKLNIKNLTTLEKIGQLIMAGFHGTTVTDEVVSLIRDYKVGNIILFSRNIESAEQLFKLTQDLQRVALKEIGIPLFISIDQEGGMVTRIYDDATYFPGAMTIAATNDVKNAYEVADKMGEELLALGINMDLAPVLDVNNNPKNPVIGVRSFSDDPQMVSDYGIAAIKGLQNHVIATAKHFPGHGDTHVDSHLALPTVEKTKEELEKFEFKPFVEAIKNGVKAIMSSHINFTHLTENNLPVTLSKRVLTDMLRNNMGFEGLIVTDGIEMKAIDDHYGAVEATLMSVNAGANLVCICHDLPYQTGAVYRILEALEKNEMSMETLNERVSRILKFKEDLQPIDLDRPYSKVKTLIENKENKVMAKNVVKDAVTLIKGETLKLKEKALIITTLPKATTIADDTDGKNLLSQSIKRLIPTLKVKEISVNPTEVEILEVMELAQNFDQIIFTTYNGNVYQSQLKLVNELITLDKDLHVLALRNPYDLYYSPAIKNYVAFYEYTPNAIEVIIEYLKGELIPKGVSPIKYE